MWVRMLKFPVNLKDIEIQVTVNSFGSQANFKLTIHGTGEVELEPYGYSFIIEDQTMLPDAESIRNLISESMEIGFFDMQAEYSRASELYITPEGTLAQGFGDILDGTQINISIEIGSEKHSIYAHWGYPKRLGDFLEKIFYVSGVSEWFNLEEE